MKNSKSSQDLDCKTRIEGLIAESRALLAKLDANSLAHDAAWHVDAAINELYASIGEQRPAEDIERLAALINHLPKSSPH